MTECRYCGMPGLGWCKWNGYTLIVCQDCLHESLPKTASKEMADKGLTSPATGDPYVEFELYEPVRYQNDIIRKIAFMPAVFESLEADHAVCRS